MSALTPHIVVLRAEAAELVDEADAFERASRPDVEAIFRALANAKFHAAAAIEEREREIEARFTIPPRRHPTAEEIEAAKTPAGGWDRETLASWGVAWPPPKGWKDALLGEEGGGE